MDSMRDLVVSLVLQIEPRLMQSNEVIVPINCFRSSSLSNAFGLAFISFHFADLSFISDMLLTFKNYKVSTVPDMEE